MSSNDKNNFTVTDLRAALIPNDKTNLVDYVKNKLQDISVKHPNVLDKLSLAVRNRVEDLRNIQAQYDDLEAKFLEERASLEDKYQKLYQPFYIKRHGIVSGKVDVEEGVTNEADASDVKGVPDFWLIAMKNNDILAEEITKRDEGPLKFLLDVKWSKLDNPKGFRLDFYFDTNPFFKNSVLTKTYHMIDENEPLLDKAIGTEIEWYPGKCVTHKILKKKPKKGSQNTNPITKTEPCRSFFNFFSPPRVPDEDEDIEEDEAEELQNILEQDYDIGSTIRDTLIPHAVSWFTGEAGEDEFGDLEDDDDEDEGEDDDEEDDEDEDVKKPSTVHRRKKGGMAPGEGPPECKQQ